METLKKGDKIGIGKLRYEFDSVVKIMGQTMIKTTDGVCFNPALVDKITVEEYRQHLVLDTL